MSFNYKRKEVDREINVDQRGVKKVDGRTSLARGEPGSIRGDGEEKVGVSASAGGSDSGKGGAQGAGEASQAREGAAGGSRGGELQPVG